MYLVKWKVNKRIYMEELSSEELDELFVTGADILSVEPMEGEE